MFERQGGDGGDVLRVDGGSNRQRTNEVACGKEKEHSEDDMTKRAVEEGQ